MSRLIASGVGIREMERSSKNEKGLMDSDCEGVRGIRGVDGNKNTIKKKKLNF